MSDETPNVQNIGLQMGDGSAVGGDVLGSLDVLSKPRYNVADGV